MTSCSHARRPALFRCALLGLGLSLSLAAPVQASSDAAWAAHRRDVVNACLQATDLGQARPAGELIEFDDRIGLTALAVTGIESVKGAKPRRARVLCVFDRKTRYAQVAEADALLTPPPAAAPAKSRGR